MDEYIKFKGAASKISPPCCLHINNDISATVVHESTITESRYHTFSVLKK
jgi:hypothetical protein